MIRGQNYFSRTRENDAKMGAFYTDTGHCRSLREMFVFPEDEEVSVLEPSVGDGVAVRTVTSADNNPRIKLFAVEVNEKAADELQESGRFTEVLKADFLEGVCIKKNAFSFCFGNPPYQNDDLTESGKIERTEDQFLKKVTQCLSKGGILCWIVPYKSFTRVNAFWHLISHYEIQAVYRFRQEEYRKYHQVVIVARKKEHASVTRTAMMQMLAGYGENDIPILPDHPAERLMVEASDSEKVVPFHTRRFDSELAYGKLRAMGADAEFDDLHKLTSRELTVTPYIRNKAGRPPIPPKKDTLYLMATSGYGAGLAGSEENKDMHLQRGVVEMVNDVAQERDPRNPKKMIERVVSRAKVTMTIVENDGRITVLE